MLKVHCSVRNKIPLAESAAKYTEEIPTAMRKFFSQPSTPSLSPTPFCGDQQGTTYLHHLSGIFFAIIGEAEVSLHIFVTVFEYLWGDMGLTRAIELGGLNLKERCVGEPMSGEVLRGRLPK